MWTSYQGDNIFSLRQQGDAIETLPQGHGPRSWSEAIIEPER